MNYENKVKIVRFIGALIIAESLKFNSFSETMLRDPFGINTEIEATIIEKFNPKK